MANGRPNGPSWPPCLAIGMVVLVGAIILYLRGAVDAGRRMSGNGENSGVDPAIPATCTRLNWPAT